MPVSGTWKFNTATGWFATHLNNTTEHCVSYFHCDNFMRHPDLRFGVALRCLMIDLGKFATVFARLRSHPLLINLNRKRWSLVTRMSGDVVTLWHVTLFRLLNCFLKEQLNIVKQHCCLHISKRHCCLQTLSLFSWILSSSQSIVFLAWFALNCIDGVVAIWGDCCGI